MSKDTLLQKLLSDPQALKWLSDHQEFGSVDNYRDGRRAFSRNANPDVQLFVEKLELVQDLLSPEHQAVSAWFVAMPPREVAERFGVPVKEVYRHFERLREAVEVAFVEYRESQLGARSGKASLETLPEHCAIATRYFEYQGRREVVYLVAQPDGEVWCDAQGNIFAEEVQDVLTELHVHAPEFQTLTGE
jgi:hypothetical protein